MKRLFIISALALLVASCVTTTTAPKEKTVQDGVIDFFLAKKQEYHQTTNDLQKKDFIDQYKHDLYHVFDSLGFLTNWQGTIKDLKRKDSGNTIDVTFTISIPIVKDYDRLDLYCEHWFDKSKADTDTLYRSLYNVSNNSLVKFDGFPITTSKQSLSWVDYSFGINEDMNLSYPRLRFWITGIRPADSQDGLSEELVHACNLAMESSKLVKLHNLKAISNAEYEERASEIKAKNLAAQEQLTEEEKTYLATVSTYALYNISF